METGKASSSNPAKGQKRKNDEQEAGPTKVRKRRTEGGCTECDRQQISCDNKLVCGNCSRSGRTCIYPGTNVFEQSPTRKEKDAKEKDAKIQGLESRVKNLEAVIFQILHSYPLPNQAPAPGALDTQASSTPIAYNNSSASGTNIAPNAPARAPSTPITQNTTSSSRNQIASSAPILTGNDLDFMDFNNLGTVHNESNFQDPASHTSDLTSTNPTSGALPNTAFTSWEDFLNLDIPGTETARDDSGLHGDASYPADLNDPNTIFGMLANANDEIPENLLE